MGTPIIRKVLVSADAIFDLRQGTLVFLNEEFAASVVSEKEYYTRDQDLFSSVKIPQGMTTPFGTLSKDTYAKLFEKNKDEIIKSSLMTKIMPFIISLYREYVKQALYTPFFSGVEIDINVFPFQFTEDEKKELLNQITELTLGECAINVVDIPLEDITPTYVKENYLSMVMYDYVPWFNHHSEEIKKTPLKDIGVYVPRLYHGEVPSEEDILEFKIRKTSPFEFMTQALAPFVVLQFLPVALYCADLPHNADEYSQLVK